MLTIAGFLLIASQSLAASSLVKQTGSARWCLVVNTTYVCEYSKVNVCENAIGTIKGAHSCELNPRLRR